MAVLSNPRFWCTGLLALAPLGMARADEPAAGSARSASQPVAEEAGINLLDAARSGVVTISAEGTGEGRMTIKVTNQTNRKLKVVLPPGLIASGATGQMGGMGGMGGGGMGGMGGGMGGMGGGMGGGGMGGGMGGGGMGGGMGGRGGGQGGGGGQLTMPAMQGLMLVGRLIMTLVEPTESWNPQSLMSGMSMMGGGMGGGMGGMGGGMGGMGGGMGGMGGGFRSVPPTDLPNATLAPNQSRDLSTRAVSLNGPNEEGGFTYPEKGEPLTLGDVSQLEVGSKVQEVLRRLARDKAPENVSQLAIWAAGGMSWSDLTRISKGWANAQELALAKQLVADLDAKSPADTGRLWVEVTAKEDGEKALAGELSKLLTSRSMLGLVVESSVPVRPSGPALACKVQFSGPGEASVQLATTDGSGTVWLPMGKFVLPVVRDEAGKVKLEAFGDSLAEEMLGRLVTVKVTKKKTSNAAKGGLFPEAPTPRAKDAYTIQVENYSSLLLNGIAVTGVGSSEGSPARVLLGISLAPRRVLSLPSSLESVERLGLKSGAKVLAVDLSGL